MKVCPGCGSAVPDGANWCPKCGEAAGGGKNQLRTPQKNSLRTPQQNSFGAQEALLFHEDGRVSSYHLGSGSFGPDYTFTYADGKLILTNEYGSSTTFLWTGEQFRSEEQYEMQVGSDYEYISKDPRQMAHFRPEEETEPAASMTK